MSIGTLAAAVGKGLFAGAAGTAVMTAAQMTVMKLQDGGSSSDAPLQAAEKVVGVEPVDEEQEERINNLVHFAYGTSWGAARGVLSALGMSSTVATATHFGLVWGAAAAMLPALRIAPPPTQWPASEIAKDGAFHLVYAIAAGLAYDMLDRSDTTTSR
jgi:hypothetical protein